MERRAVIEIVALYWPLCLAVFLCFALQPQRRERAAIVLTTLWQAASLIVLNALGLYLGWWKFAESDWAVFGMPVSFYLGWLVLWGPVGVLLMRLLRWYAVVVVLCIFDLLLMPLMQPVLLLGSQWLLGELILIALGLVPGMLLARWVIRDERPGVRTALVSLAFAFLVMVFFPVIGSHWLGDMIDVRVAAMSTWFWWTSIGIMFFAALPALAGVMEFAREGRGTPIPFDPPKRLVVTGIYSYITNPMQTSMVCVLLLEGVLFQSWVCVVLAIGSVVYAEGVAQWSEGDEMRRRYGNQWRCYLKRVPRWRFSIFPGLSDDLTEARLYYAKDCSVCREVGSWFIGQLTPGLEVTDTSFYTEGVLERITYVSMTGQKRSGVDAIAASLQHIHLGWAMCGWLLQLPGVCHVVQLAMDASGAAPERSES